MADPFALQRRTFKALLKDRPSTQEGMRSTVETILAARPHVGWDRLVEFDWTQVEQEFEGWLRALLDAEPPPSPVAAFWIEAPDVFANEASTSVMVFPSVDTDDERLGLDQGHEWPSSVERGTLEWKGFERAIELAGLRADDLSDEQMDTLEPAVLALTHAMASLVAINVLPGLEWTKKLVAQREVLVFVSWFDGDPDPIGVLSGAGWGKFKRK